MRSVSKLVTGQYPGTHKRSSVWTGEFQGAALSVHFGQATMCQRANVTECRGIGCEAETVMVGLGRQDVFGMCSRTPAIIATDAHLLIVKVDGYGIALWQLVDVPGFFEVLHCEGPGTDVGCRTWGRRLTCVGLPEGPYATYIINADCPAGVSSERRDDEPQRMCLIAGDRVLRMRPRAPGIIAAHSMELVVDEHPVRIPSGKVIIVVRLLHIRQLIRPD